MKILKERSLENITVSGLLLCVDHRECWEKQKLPRDLPATVMCSTHNVKHIQTTCSSCPWPCFHQTSPGLFAPSVPGNSQLQELPKLPHLFWPLVAQCAPGKQCQQQLLIAGKASNHSEVVWVPQLYFCLLCSWLHTHKPQRLQFHAGGGRSLPSYVILSNCTAQPTSEDLLTCQAGHMFKYFLEIMPDTTSPNPLLLLHPHSPPEVLRACSERTLLTVGTVASTRIMLRNVVRSWSKCTQPAACLSS